MRCLMVRCLVVVLCLLGWLPHVCTADCLSGFTAVSGSVLEDSCYISIRASSSGTWAGAQWQSQLPTQFSLSVDLSRPSTNSGCDQMGFVIGDAAYAGAMAASGIRVLVMSSDGWCDDLGVPHDPGNPGRLVVEDASSVPMSVEGRYLSDPTYWHLDNALPVAVSHNGSSVSVWAGSSLVGSFPCSLPDGSWLTLVAFDQDEPSVFQNLSVPETGVPGGLTLAGHVLRQNRPNPLNSATTIQFDLSVASLVSIRILDLSGRNVRELLSSAPYEPGEHSIVWDGRNDSGSPVGTGVYLYCARVGGLMETRKMVLLK